MQSQHVNMQLSEKLFMLHFQRYLSNIIYIPMKLSGNQRVFDLIASLPIRQFYNFVDSMPILLLY